jgi:charged multivesicular body protein 1
MGNKISLEDNLIELRMVSKQMIRSSKKCEKNEKAALGKLKKVRRIKKKDGLLLCLLLLTCSFF